MILLLITNFYVREFVLKLCTQFVPAVVDISIVIYLHLDLKNCFKFDIIIKQRAFYIYTHT